MFSTPKVRKGDQRNICCVMSSECPVRNTFTFRVSLRPRLSCVSLTAASKAKGTSWFLWKLIFLVRSVSCFGNLGNSLNRLMQFFLSRNHSILGSSVDEKGHRSELVLRMWPYYWYWWRTWWLGVFHQHHVLSTSQELQKQLPMICLIWVYHENTFSKWMPTTLLLLLPLSMEEEE